MHKYLLNSAVITAPGVYSYDLLTKPEAQAWARNGDWQSTIGYAETAAALSELLGQPVPVDRRMITMAPGDEALVFRLVFPRIDPKDKGTLRALLNGHYELGLLRREQ